MVDVVGRSVSSCPKLPEASLNLGAAEGPLKQGLVLTSKFARVEVFVDAHRRRSDPLPGWRRGRLNYCAVS